MAARGCVTPAETPYYYYYYRSAVPHITVTSGKKEMENELFRGLHCFCLLEDVCLYARLLCVFVELCVLA